MISKEIKFLFTHSSIYGIGTVISRVVAFILLPLYTHYLTPSDYGVLETIDISSSLIGIVVTVGIARALSRFYYESEHPRDRYRIVSTTYISYIIIVFPIIPLLFYVSTPLSILLFETARYGYYFNISFISLAIGGLIDIGMIYLRLTKKSAIFISVTLLRLLFLITLNVVFIAYYHLGVLGVLYSSLIVKTIFGIFITVLILWKTKFVFSFTIFRNLLSYGLPMIPSSLANVAVKQSDKYFVLYFLSIADMGIYSLALKIGNVIHSLFTTPFNMAYIPRRFEIMNKQVARETYSRIFTYYVFFIVYAGLALSAFTPEILHFMVDEKFQSAAKIIPFVVFSMIIFGAHRHFDFGILFSKKTKFLAYINICCAIIHLLCNFILIQRFGLYGAVFSSIIVLTIQAGMFYRISQRFYPIPYKFKRILTYIFVAVLFFSLSRLSQTNIIWVNILIKLILLFAFPFAIYNLKILDKQERKRVKEYISGRLFSTKQKDYVIKHTERL